MEYQKIEILIVDDNIDDVELTLRNLRKSGFLNEIHTVIDGAEALDFIYSRGQYVNMETPGLKLILLDLKMPKVSGIQVLEKIKSDPKTKSIPVVILTSSNQDPDIKKCYELGANSYIVKPVDGDKFFQAIKGIGIYWMILNHPHI